MQNQRPTSMRIVREQDIPAIAEYLSEEMGNSARQWQHIMRHWWQDNPAFAEQTSMGWLIEAGGKIVGFLGNIPIKFQFQGNEIVSYNPTTWFVSKDYRGNPHSRQLFHEFGLTADNTLSFITTPASHVVRFYRDEMRYREFPLQPGAYHYYVYNHAKFLKLDTSRKRRFLHTPLLPIYRWWQERGLNAYHGELEVRQISSIGNEFDSLWHRSRRNYPNTQCRDRKSLNWFLSGHRSAEKMLYGCFEKGVLMGFGLFMRKSDQGRICLECIDLWGSEKRLETFTAILHQLINVPPYEDIAFLKIPVCHAEVAQACSNLAMASAELSNYYMLRYGDTFKRRMTADETYLSGIHGDYALF